MHFIELLGRIFLSFLFLFEGIKKLFFFQEETQMYMEEYGVPEILFFPSTLLEIILPIFIIIGFAIAIGMTTLSFVVGQRKPDNEKLSAYECGFEAFDDARGRFDVRFYLVAILFIIFDLEVAFLFPWAISLGTIGLFGFWSMMIFLLILTIGFIYEWKKGALEWE